MFLRIVIFSTLLLPSLLLAQWLPQTSGTESHFRSISAINEKVLWAGGTKGTVLYTVNGGENWTVLQVIGAEKLDFRGIKGLNEKTAVAVSAGLAEEGQARIYRTEDAGKTWQQVWATDQKGVFLDGIAFWDKKNGLIFGDPIDNHLYLLKTADGGKTWERLSPTALPANLPNEASFAASNSTMVVQGSKNVWVGTGGADHARVFRSNDRGATWQVTDAPMKANASSGIFGLHFWGAMHGIAVGGDYKADKEAFENVILTQDGGKTWQNSTPTNPAGLKEAVYKLKNGTLIAVGPAGSCISKDNAKTWQPLSGAPNGLHAMACAGNTCWAIGSKGQIVKLSN
ncbi:WD40/YVTN/BNR-like repeat-containing protein [Runella sp.]|uniref:WD40/YVTN/BNR-like repeat-containing protein n=1 Tax=Runella sp. TaxID=1960881 RepID=UPI003D0C0435